MSRKLICAVAFAGFVYASTTSAQPDTDDLYFAWSDTSPPWIQQRFASFVDAHTAWIGLYRTTDGGVSWHVLAPVTETASSVVESRMADIANTTFISADRGWLAVDGLWATDDGGLHWKRQLPYTGAGSPVFAGTKGWVPMVSDDDRMLHFTSDDTGRSWNKCRESDSLREWSSKSAYFLNPSVGWALFYRRGDDIGEEYGIMKTEDGGCTWKQLWISTSVKDRLGSVYFLDTQNGWIAGADHGPLLRTEDGGYHWRKLRLPESGFNVVSVYFRTVLEGWVSGTYPREQGDGSCIFHTMDGGDTWRELTKSELRTGSHYCPGVNAIPEGWKYGRLLQMVSAGHAKRLAQSEPTPKH